MNLISVSQLTVKGIDISLKRKSAGIYHDGLLMAVAKKVDPFYRILTEWNVTDAALLISLKDQTPTTLWHYHLGNLHQQAVLQLSCNELVREHPALQANKKTGRCNACLKGKMIRTLFKPATPSTTAPLELIHSDMCGPMQQKSFGGCRYVLLLIDDFTKFTAVYFWKKNSESAECFKAYQTHVAKVHHGKAKNYVLKSVRTDNGGEYTGDAFQRQLRRCGIEFQSTVPYTP